MKLERIALKDLSHDQNNRRRHGQRNLEVIRASLERFGQRMPLAVRGGVVVIGNGRLQAMRDLGWTHAYVTPADDLTPEDARDLALVDNRSAELAEWDDQLGATLMEIGDKDVLDGLGWDEVELASFVAGLGDDAGDVDEDEVPEAPKVPVTNPGDVWELGRHRVVCGDALDAEKPGPGYVMVTDPPYGVDYDPKWREALGKANKARNKVRNDDRADWSELWAMLPSGIAYVWSAPGQLQLIAGAALESGGFSLRQQLVWVKPYPAFSRSRYSYRHEPCWFAAKGDGARWTGDSKQASVMEAVQPGDPYGKGEARYGHPTQKPVKVMAIPIGNHAGDVYDPFLGSGTTLIAAEQLDRTCYGIEIEPRYVDVTVERWENLTGGKAKRVKGRRREA